VTGQVTLSLSDDAAELLREFEQISDGMSRAVIVETALANLKGTDPARVRAQQESFDDRLAIHLPRKDAVALVHMLDRSIDQQGRTGYGALLRSLQVALIDACGHIRPDRPPGMS
jgi:hypothetical protein